MIKVVVLGGGNVAFHLSKNLLKSKNVQLVQIWNRTIDAIEIFRNQTDITTNIDNLKIADVYILAISDDAVANFSKQLNFPNKLVVHTSGSVALNDLKCNANKGVFYPLQTFSKNRNVNFGSVPICIETEKQSDLKTIKTIAKSLSNSIYEINSEQRTKLHLAAVIVNNFVNHLYYLAQELCNENKLPFNALLPLINETTEKLNTLDPYHAQTGPAKRADIQTIKKHTLQLKGNQKKIYKLLSKSILETYGKKL